MSEKTFIVKLTESEMQFIVNAVTGFYNVMNQENRHIDIAMTATISRIFEAWKSIIDNDGRCMDASDSSQTAEA